MPFTPRLSWKNLSAWTREPTPPAPPVEEPTDDIDVGQPETPPPPPAEPDTGGGAPGTPVEPPVDEGGDGDIGIDQPDTPPVEEDETDEAGGEQPTSPPEPPVTEDGGGTGTLIAPVPLDKTGAVSVDGGRVTVFSVETAQSIASVEITDAPAQGVVTVNPDNTLALVLSGNDFSGALSFDYKITYANGATETRSAALTVAAPEQQAGWGQGKHYMLETDAQGDLVIETGDNHRKVYVSGSDTALTRADIAAREGVNESKVTGKWLLDHAEYGGSEGMALASDIGIELWDALLFPNGPEPIVASHWLMFEKGYTYENAGQLIGVGASGESPLQPIYISSWGNGERPVLTDQIKIFQLKSQNIVIDNVAPVGGIMNLGGENLIINDSEFTGGGVNIQQVDGFTLRDSDLAHITNPLQTDGYWAGGGTAVFSKEASGILMEGNIFHHNGWEDDYLLDGSTTGGVPPSMLAHGVYLQNTTLDVTARDNIVSQSSSVGVQFRGGAFIEDNVFVDNNVAVNMMGGIYEAKGDGPIGNFTFFTDNLITSGAHKNTDIGMGGLTVGVDVKAINTTLLDNIIAHLADPDNPEELAQKTVTHDPLTIRNGVAYDDTIIYNWTGGGWINPSKITDNGKVTDTARADQTTIQNFAADVLGKDKATIAELMDAILADKVSVTADDIIDYFQAGFGVAASGDGSATEHRFIPNALADGIRWDNRINWSHEELPDAGDSVDLGGNHVQYGGTTRLADLDLGGGALHVNSGKLSVDGTLASTGAAGLIQTLNAGQFWTDGYAGAQRLTIDVDGGRFANTGAVTGKTLLQASDGQTLLATSGASYTLGTGSTLVVEGSEARIGFDGPGAGTARLTMTDNSTLVFKGDAGGFSTIEEFRSGAWDQAGSPVTSSVTLDGTLRVDLSGYAGGAGSHKLIAADELMGSFDEIKFVGLGGGLDADLVVDYVTDTVWLDLS